MITPNEARDRYDKMDYEGGFWEYVAHSGTSILDGTPFEAHKAMIVAAEDVARRYEQWLDEHSEDADDEFTEDFDYGD